MMTVHEVSKITGVSIRTLHYYDEIGLLCPSQVTEAGYRMYDNNMSFDAFDNEKTNRYREMAKKVWGDT